MNESQNYSPSNMQEDEDGYSDFSHREISYENKKLKIVKSEFRKSILSSSGIQNKSSRKKNDEKSEYSKMMHIDLNEPNSDIRYRLK